MKTNDYEMITLKAYLDTLEDNKDLSWEDEIKNNIEKQYLKVTNARKSSKFAA